MAGSAIRLPHSRAEPEEDNSRGQWLKGGTGSGSGKAVPKRSTKGQFAALQWRSAAGTTGPRAGGGLTSAVRYCKRTSDDLAEAKGAAFPPTGDGWSVLGGSGLKMLVAVTSVETPSRPKPCGQDERNSAVQHATAPILWASHFRSERSGLPAIQGTSEMNRRTVASAALVRPALAAEAGRS